MDYNLCKDNGNITRCDFDCRKCANLVYDAVTDKNNSLKIRLDNLAEKFDKLTEEKDGLQSLFQIKSKDNAELIDKCQEIEKKNAWLEKECEKLRDDNQRFANECRYYIERESNLVKENDELRITNDKLRTMNSDLLYRNGLLMETTGPAVFQKVYGYAELSDKIESLKEDIIRLDKCLSKRQCVQLERIKEERDGE